ncbi:hypothetical protein HQ560_12450, partial [bacterium]|nr:hypothetical protein [bacterium]
RVLGADKTEEPWGTSVRIKVRGERDADTALPFVVEITDRKRAVLKRDAVLFDGLQYRQESAYTIRLRNAEYNDVGSCRIVDE